MAEENISQAFWWKNIEETTNCFIKEIDHNKLMSNKHKKVCMTLNYIEHFLTLAFAVTYLNFCFTSLLDLPVENMISAIGLKICAITAGIKKYKSI